MISAAIVAFNEAKKLDNCLNSIKDIVDEIIVVDLGSSDNLDDVLQKYAQVKKITHERVPYVEPLRQLSIDKCKGDWILILDPDEQVSRNLAKELKKISDNKEFSADALNVPTKNIFWGHWIAHTNFWPDRHMRFFRKGKVQWGKNIHSYPKVAGKKYDLPASPDLALIHYGYDSRKQFITKQKRYALVEAQNRLAAGGSFSLQQLLWMPMREFLARFIKHKGYLDGFDGIYLVMCLMYYQIMVQINMIRYAKNYQTF